MAAGFYDHFSWSFSRLKMYERCPWRYKLKFKSNGEYPEPEIEFVPDKKKGTTEKPNERGTRIHKGLEQYIRGETDKLVPEGKAFKALLDHSRQLYGLGLVHMEEKWGFDRNWEAANYMDAWLRLAIDEMVVNDKDAPTHALIIDWKTGKREGNESDHARQGRLYQAAAFARIPTLVSITVEFWYVDTEELTSIRYKRVLLPATIKRFNQDAATMENDCMNLPKPDKFSCSYCGYATDETCSFAWNKDHPN